MSTAYGTDLGISATNLLIILFVTQIVACPFALLYGKLSETFTGKNAICRYYYLHHYLHICLFLKNDTRFLDFSNVSCYFSGRIQALSRSYFAKLIPKESANEFLDFIIYLANLPRLWVQY